MSHNLVVALDEPHSQVVNVAVPISSETVDITSSGPPTYDEAVNPEGPPPSYDSLFGRVKQVHAESGGTIDFMKNALLLLMGTVGCSIVIGVTVVVPFSMIVIGVIYLYECPQGEYIPVYLLVGGLLGVLKQLFHLSATVRHGAEAVAAERMRQSPAQAMLNCFMLGWFIIGSVWVYEKYEPNYDPSLGAYCNKTLYLFAFWLITTVYLLIGGVTICLCSLSILSLACQRGLAASE